VTGGCRTALVDSIDVARVRRRQHRVRDEETVDTVETLIIELLEWIGPDARPYAEVQEAWRTSCPRLPIWEDAMAAGYLDTRVAGASERLVAVSASGRRLLARSGRALEDQDVR
jgi:hypothetical protein